MRYYVLWPDGRKFGPVDVPTLNQWIAEGRVLEDMTLEDADTGQELLARDVRGLVFLDVIGENDQGTIEARPRAPITPPPDEHPFQQPPQPFQSPYPRGDDYYVDPTAGDALYTWSLVCSIIGFLAFCCFPLPGVGLFLAYRAKAARHPSSYLAIVIGWVSLMIGVAFWGIRFLLAMTAFSRY